AWIPASLNFEQPNPEINFAGLNLQVQQTGGPWPAGEWNAIAGVKFFGFGGTKGPAVLPQQFVLPENHPRRGPRETYLLPVSARSAEALESMVKKFSVGLSEQIQPALEDICYTAAVRRTHHDHRLAVVGKSPGEMREKLEAFLASENRT